MTQVASCRPLTTEARVRTRVTPYGNNVGDSGPVTGSSPSSSGLPCQHHSIVALHANILRMNNRPVIAPCNFVEADRRFRGFPMVEAVRTSETSVTFN
jgi:hypothetical protein